MNLVLRKPVLLLILFAISSCRQRELTARNSVTETPLLRVGTDATYAPFESRDSSGKWLVGFDIDLMNELTRRLGYKVKYIVVPFDGIIAGLKEGKYAAIISAMTITPPRAKEISFTRPYYVAGQSIAVRADKTGINSITDLPGKKIGVQLGTTGEILAKKILAAEVVSYDDINSAFIDLQKGNVAAIINDIPTNRLILKQRKGLRIVGGPLTSENYGIAVRKSDLRLLTEFNLVLDQLDKEGYLNKLKDKWDLEEIVIPTTSPGSFIVKEIKTLLKIVRFLLPAIPLTLQITGVAFLLSFILGLSLALLRISNIKPIESLVRIYVDIIRGVPLLVQIFFIYFGLGSLFFLGQFTAGVLAIAVCYSAFLEETFRAGIQAIPRGQFDASRSLGMNSGQTMWYIILPQAIRINIPPLVNEFIACLKDSSLVSMIGLRELTRAGREYTAGSFIVFEMWIIVGLIYLGLTFILSWIGSFIETKWKTK